jgi:hypothetical protein
MDREKATERGAEPLVGVAFRLVEMDLPTE